MSGSVDCLAGPCKCVVFFFNLCNGAFRSLICLIILLVVDGFLSFLK